MKTALLVPLSEEELAHLYGIIIDRDQDGALAFLDQHLKKKVRRALEGG